MVDWARRRRWLLGAAGSGLVALGAGGCALKGDANISLVQGKVLFIKNCAAVPHARPRGHQGGDRPQPRRSRSPSRSPRASAATRSTASSRARSSTPRRGSRDAEAAADDAPGGRHRRVRRSTPRRARARTAACSPPPARAASARPRSRRTASSPSPRTRPASSPTRSTRRRATAGNVTISMTNMSGVAAQPRDPGRHRPDRRARRQDPDLRQGHALDHRRPQAGHLHLLLPGSRPPRGRHVRHADGEVDAEPAAQRGRGVPRCSST